jgi:pyruvate dehydrogenase E1 component
MASTVPACQAYDPAFAYELAAIIEDGLRRMYVDNEDIFYYLAIYNENYEQPPKPEGVDQGILQGLYKWADSPDGVSSQATVLFSGPSHLAAREAQAELAERWGVGIDLWSATSYKRLREQALEIERWNRLHPEAEPRTPLVTSLLADAPGPVVAVSDFIRSVPEQIARFVPARFNALGTDGYGRSDDRQSLRKFFETDAPNLVLAVLTELANEGSLDRQVLIDAVKHYQIDPDQSPPWTR